jgi:hypothetical protein
MRGSSALHRPEAGIQNFAKISAAFLIGLVTVFISALVYSNLEQRRELASASPFNAGPTHRSPAISVPEEGGSQNTNPAVVAVSPQSSRSRTAPARPIARTYVVVQQPIRVSSAGARSEAPQNGSVHLPLLPFGPVSSVSPQLPPSALAQQERVIAEPSQAHSEPASPSVSGVVVPATTALTVQLSDTLSSDGNRPGDAFRATLAAPLIINGYLVAASGAALQGRVEAVRKAPLIGGRSELSVTLNEVRTWDGQHLRLQTGLREVKGANLKAAVGSAFIARTRAAVLPAGAQMTFILVSPLPATGTRTR